MNMVSKLMVVGLISIATASTAICQTTGNYSPKELLDFALKTVVSQGDSAKAKALLLDALKQDTNYAPAIFNYALICTLDDDVEEAKKWFTRYLGISPEQPRAKEAKDRLNEIAKLEKILADPAKRSDRNYYKSLYRAERLAAYGLFQDSLRLTASAAKSFPNRSEAFVLASSTCIKAGLISEARDFLEKAIQLSSGDSRTKLELCREQVTKAERESTLRGQIAVAIESQDYPLAEKYILQLMDSKRGDPKLKIQLASILLLQGQSPRARQLLMEVSELKFDSVCSDRAKRMIRVLEDMEAFNTMMRDKTLRHPSLEGIEDKMRELGPKVGITSDNADFFDNVSREWDNIRQNALSNNNTSLAGTASIVQVVSMFKAANKRDEAAEKRKELFRLAEQRKQLSKLSKQNVVGSIAMLQHQYGIAEIAFGNVPDKERDSKFFIDLGMTQLNMNKLGKASETFKSAGTAVLSLPVETRAQISKLWFDLGEFGECAKMLTTNPGSLLDYEYKGSEKLATQKICELGSKSIVKLNQNDKGIIKRCYFAFRSYNLAIIAGEYFIATAKREDAAKIWSDYAIKTKEATATDNQRGLLQLKAARMYLSLNNKKKAAELAKLARAYGVWDQSIDDEMARKR